MAVKPKLALIPSGVKASKVYSVLPSNGVGDFDFSRSGEATRINKDGLIETVDSNVPRLNYPLIDGVVSGCPSLLLEPQSTNLVTYSEDFTDASWANVNSTDLANQTISPDGTNNATLLTKSAVSGYLSRNYTFVGGEMLSFFIKANDSNFVLVDNGGGRSYFDLVNGVSNVTSGTGSIEDYGNGWFRCSISNAFVGASSVRVYPSDSLTSLTGATGSVYIWGAMLEQGSYPTSYIPTSGSTATRSAETCNNAGDVNTFNDSEGVLMVEMSALNNTVSAYNSIGLGNGLVTNRIGLGFQPNDTIYAYKRGGSSAYWLPFKTVDITSLNKVALSYNTNDNHFWVNGFKIASNTTIGDASNLTELEFEASYGLEEFYGNTKQIQYFDTALNDTDLEELTSWQSFNEMATAQQYSIL